MKAIKSIILFLMIVLVGCEMEYFDSPNAPSTPPSASVFNNAMESIVTNTRDEWFMGRFTQVTMQYWQQSEYGDEDRYGYRESTRETWATFYYNLENLRIVIALNEDPETKDNMLAYGANENQIGCTRVMMAYIFNLMADTWGDIPYYSYGSDNPNFQALQMTDEVFAPRYATQEEIYTDILKELQEAHDQMDDTKDGFIVGDNVYDGDISKWKLFANSLRLRIAVKIQDANPTLAQTHIADAIADGVFTSNADNAAFHYETSDKNASPMYQAWNVDNRSDFAVSNTLVTLLKGDNIYNHDGTNITTPLTNNPFFGIYDPRIEQYVETNKDTVYVGMPIAESSAVAATITWESLPNKDNIIEKPDYAVVLMQYAEVEFLLSEINAWDQTHYINGIEASMQKWGVSQDDIDAYTAAVPAANEERVLTQKYIALYMDGHTAWTEYRRTGYPNILLKPGDNYSVIRPPYWAVEQGENVIKPEEHYLYNFSAIPLEITNDLPMRMQYPGYERTLNSDNYLEAVGRLANGDILTSPLWWDKN